MTEVIRDRMLTLGELDYCDQYAFVVKARDERERKAALARDAEAASSEGARAVGAARALTARDRVAASRTTA